MGDKPEPLFRVGEAEVYRAVDHHRLPKEHVLVPMLFQGDVEGAIPAGTRIEKTNSEDKDSYPDGTRGTVMASLRCDDEFVYYVSFDPSDGLPCLIMGHRIKEVR